MGKASGLFISGRHLWWTILILVSMAAGVSSVFVNPLIIIAALFLLANVVLIVKYPFWGLLSYLMIFLLRPGEMYPSLSALRLELVTGLFVLLVVVIRQKIIEHRVTLPSDPITLALVGFMIVMCLSIFTSYDKGRTVDTCLDFVKLLIFYYLIVSLIDTRAKFVAFMSAFSMMITYIAFDAFKSYIAGGYITRMGVDRLYGSTSAGGDPNTLAATLAATIPIVLASAVYFRQKILKTALIALGLFMVTLIAITASRSGMIAFMGVAIGGFIFTKKKIVVALAFVILLPLGWMMLPDQYKDRYRTITEVEDLDETSSGRWHIWQAGLKMIVARPFIGVGAGAFAYANGSGDFGPSRWMQPHNLYIQCMAETGLLGFLIWFGVYIRNLVKKLLQLSAHGLADHNLYWIRVFSIGFLVSMIALSISGVFSHNLYRYTWYMMAGLTVVLDRFATEYLQNKNIETQKMPQAQEAV